MKNKTYAPEQLTFAERVAKAVAGVPEDKRPALETIVECVLIGAGVASDPARWLSASERPGA